jgi:ParB-like chromosome segregation protein Spo0J
MTSSNPHTLEITYRRLSELHRRHSRKQLAQIAASIQKFGFTNPVLIADHDQMLAGDARLQAVRLLGMSESRKIGWIVWRQVHHRARFG